MDNCLEVDSYKKVVQNVIKREYSPEYKTVA